MPATLQVGVRCAALVALHEQYQTHCSAFITACNPHGMLLDTAVNERQQWLLCADILGLGLAAIPGTGEHPTGAWPAEPSYLVPGLARDIAQSLGRKFQQNAIIWTDVDAVPQLLLLR